MSWTQERARVASLTRSRAANDPELIEARAALRAERRAALADGYIRKLVEAAPELTEEQRSRLALLLRGGGQAA